MKERAKVKMKQRNKVCNLERKLESKKETNKQGKEEELSCSNGFKTG